MQECVCVYWKQGKKKRRMRDNVWEEGERVLERKHKKKI